MLAALAKVREQFGKEHELLIDGVRQKGAKQITSINPSKPSEVVGVVQGASAEQAKRAVEAANEYFPTWRAVPASERAGMLIRLAEIIRERKLEFDAWQVYEAGKTWIEADADVAEAIDFCDYYARMALRFDSPDPVPQLPGERDELRYIPLGVGVVIPPWNFPLAILLGTATAALVAGNTIVLKPSSDTPTNAAVFVEAALEAGFPPKALNFVSGSGSEIGDTLVEHPKTRFISFTGSKEVGLRINQLAATPQSGQIWIKRVVAEMGGKDGIVVDSECDLDAAVHGVFISAFGFQGQKCSACSRAMVDEKVYDEFLEKLKAKVAAVKVGSSDDPANYMGPVINEGARTSILNYIEVGKGEGRLICG
ncbi:MAG: aldehyde dehydrogenase family protein, partial [bacterium]|nr:aldehyde dehydrogenase family protein [bacterium]